MSYEQMSEAEYEAEQQRLLEEQRAADDGFGKPAGETLDAMHTFSDEMDKHIGKRGRLSMSWIMFAYGVPKGAPAVLQSALAVSNNIIASLLVHGYITLTEKGERSLVEQAEAVEENVLFPDFEDGV